MFLGDRLPTRNSHCSTASCAMPFRLFGRRPRRAAATGQTPPGPTCSRDDGAEQRVGVGVVDRRPAGIWPIWRRLPSKTTIRSQCVRPVSCSCSPVVVVLFGRLARAFDEHLTSRPRNGWLSSSLISFCSASSSLLRRRFTSSGTSSAIQLGALGAGALAVLEDEAVLEPRLADQLDRLLEIVVRLAAEADDEVAGHGGAGNRLADAGEHLAVLFDRVAALHPLQHVVRAALRRHVQIRRHFGRSRTAASRSSVMSLG